MKGGLIKMDDTLYDDDEVDELFQGLESMRPELPESEDAREAEVSFMKRYQKLLMKGSALEIA